VAAFQAGDATPQAKFSRPLRQEKPGMLVQEDQDSRLMVGQAVERFSAK